MDILKTIKKNIIKMLILAISFSAISYVFVGFIQMQKISVNVYVNDKYLKEMNDDAKYILSSYDFNTYLMNNSSYSALFFLIFFITDLTEKNVIIRITTSTT